MKVLHITNWYYSEAEPHKVPFIKEHIEALNFFCKNELIHLEVQDDKSFFKKNSKGLDSMQGCKRLDFSLPHYAKRVGNPINNVMKLDN